MFLSLTRRAIIRIISKYFFDFAFFENFASGEWYASASFRFASSHRLHARPRPCVTLRLRFSSRFPRFQTRGERKSMNFLETVALLVINIPRDCETATLDTHHFKRIRLQSSQHGARLPLNICFTSCLPRLESNRAASVCYVFHIVFDRQRSVRARLVRDRLSRSRVFPRSTAEPEEAVD